MAKAEIRVGTSGWNYWHWKGVFYPNELPRDQWFAHYEKEFDTVELNASFYHVPRPSTFARWRAASGRNFLWSVKAHRGITHFTRLAGREPLDKFLSAAEHMGQALGAILFQLPPSLRFDARVVRPFLGWLPEGRSYAMEPRHASWFEPEAVDLLRQRNVALCMADSGGRFPSGEHRTADFVYLRFHGGERLYASRYTRKQMGAWAEKLATWEMPAFVYFNNDFHGFAVENARELKEELEQLAGRGRTTRRGRTWSAGARKA